jgi:transcription antitermination factor NusA-like protein
MGGVKNTAPPTPLELAIEKADGPTSLARKLTERGHDVKSHRTVNQWSRTRVPAEYCPDIEAITGVRCEQLRPDVNWSVLRKAPAKLSREHRKAA